MGITVDITTTSIIALERNRGMSGYSGSSGKSGYSGANPGASGYSGYSGKSGYSGISGKSGYSGLSGFSGYSGRSAYSGYSGLSGFSGYSAYSGFSGISGFSGYSGKSGYSGISGYSGYSGAVSTSLPLLASPTLNLNTNTKQTLYTVPIGKSAVVTEIVARSASVDLSGGTTTRLTFGFNAGATDWNNVINFDPRTLTSSGLFQTMDQWQAVGGGSGGQGGPSTIGTAAQTFGAITDASFGSAATVVVDVLGYTF